MGSGIGLYWVLLGQLGRDLLEQCEELLRARGSPLKFPGSQLTESQNGRGWKGPLWVTQPNLLLKQGHLHQAVEDLVQVGLEYLQRWWSGSWHEARRGLGWDSEVEDEPTVGFLPREEPWQPPGAGCGAGRLTANHTPSRGDLPSQPDGLH